MNDSLLRRRVRFALAAAAFVLVYYGLQFALRGFWEPDEARFVYISREMAETGSWWLPLRNGLVYAHKPPLMMWLIHLGAQIFPSPFGERLPVFIGAWFATMAIWAIGFRFGGRRVAMTSVGVAFTSQFFWKTMSFGQIDSLLTGLLFAGLALLWCSPTPRISWTRVICAGLCFGFATFAKGPVGFAVPLGALALAHFFPIDIREARPRMTPARIAVVVLLTLLIPALWLLGAWLGGVEKSYFDEIVFSQTVNRTVQASYGHKKPLLYFLWTAPVMLLPWTPAVITAFIKLWRPHRTQARFLLAWLLWVVVFFSIPSSKRSVYVVTIAAPASIAIALAYEEFNSCRWLQKTLKVLLIAFFVVSSVVFPILNCVKCPGEVTPLAAKYLPSPTDRIILWSSNSESIALHANHRGWEIYTMEELRDAFKKQPKGLIVVNKKVHPDFSLDGLPVRIVEDQEFRFGKKKIHAIAYDATTGNEEK